MDKKEMREYIDSLPPRDLDVWADITIEGKCVQECMIKYDMSQKQVEQAEQREDIRYMCSNRITHGDPHEIIDQLMLELQAFKKSL